MLRDRTTLGCLAVGALAAAVALAHAVATGVLADPATPGGPFGKLLVAATLLVVPFAVAAGAAAFALRHRVVLPFVTLLVLAALPALPGLSADQLLVGVLVLGPLAVVVALAETLVRARLGRLRNPPTEAGYRAISLGVMAALLYVGVFTIRAALPLWRLGSGGPEAVPAAIVVDLPLTIWYVLGTALVLVGVPVALHRRFDLLAPLVGLVGYLLVDLAYLQPLVAEGATFVGVLLLAVWPTLAAVFAGAGVVEWWVRDRRGEYDEPEEGEEGGGGGGKDDGEGLTLEGGLFGDRV